MTTTPTQDELADFLLSCRFDEGEEVGAFLKEYGAEGLAAAKDERGNTALHMACGNGHLGESAFSDTFTGLAVWAGSLLLIDQEASGRPSRVGGDSYAYVHVS